MVLNFAKPNTLNSFFPLGMSTKNLEAEGAMSSVAAYYNGKSILITGATGFMGKVLMEKLLRSSPNVKAIYILVRPKAGQSMQNRVENMVNCKVRILTLNRNKWELAAYKFNNSQQHRVPGYSNPFHCRYHLHELQHKLNPYGFSRDL